MIGCIEFHSEESVLKYGLILSIFILLAAGCTPNGTPAASVSTATATATPAPAATETPTLAPSPSPSAALTLAALKNATYVLRSSGEPVQVILVDGAFKLNDAAHNQSITGKLVEPAATGDLNEDGEPDAAVIIAANFGGSGTFHELIVVLSKSSQIVQAGNLALGDRLQEKQLTIQQGIISLDYLRQGANDPMCCPSEHALTTYQLKADKLVVLSDQVVK